MMDNNQQNQTKLQQLIQAYQKNKVSVFSILFIVIALGFITSVLSAHAILAYSKHHIASTATVADAVPVTKSFVSPLIEAESAIVYDPNTQTVLYEKNAESPRVIASITKMMTALIAYPFIAADPQRTVRIEKEDLDTLGDQGLIAGEVWKLSSLVDFMMITSSNDAAMAITQSLMPYEAFITAMNTRAKEMQATLVFTNPSGLDNSDETIAGTTGTAKDVALLVSEVLRHSPKVLENTSEPELTFVSESGKIHKAINTNKAIPGIPQLIGGKTGFTDLAGGNLVIIVNAGLNKPIIIVVLGSSVNGRFTDAQALASSTLQYFSS